MIELIINNRPIILDKDFKFKLIFDNPYFTKSSTYTRDIKVPMNSNVNKLALGNISRIDVVKDVTSFDVRLNIDNLIELTGKAIIRSVAEDYVNIQCVFNNSSFNFSNRVGEKHIDELMVPDTSTWEVGYIPDPSTGLFDRPWLTANEDPSYWKLLFGWYPYRKYIHTPIWNESDNMMYNTAMAYTNDKGEPAIMNALLKLDAAPQPYLGWTFEWILQQIGYTTDSDVVTKIFDQLFIASGKKGRHINDILPHWSLNKFFTELERFMGIVLIIDQNNVEIIRTEDYYTEVATRTPLDVVNTYTVEIDTDEDADEDITTGNVGYNLEKTEYDEFRKLDFEQIRNRILVLKENEELGATVDKMWNADKEDAQYYVFEKNDKHYIVMPRDKTYDLKEVNQYRDLIRDAENSSVVELNIVPVTMGEQKVSVGVLEGDAWHGTPFVEKWKGYARMPITNTDNSYVNPKVSVIDMLDGEEETQVKKDVIEVAYNNVTPENQNLELIHGPANKSIPFPSVYCDYDEQLDGRVLPKKRKKSMRLYPLENKDVESEYHRLTPSLAISQRVEYSFSFLSRKIESIRDVFIVANNQYVAKKIEIEVTQDGINPLQKGIFYALD